MEPVLGPHARTDRTRNAPVVIPRLPAPEDRRQGKGQRLTPDAPHTSGSDAFPSGAGHGTLRVTRTGEQAGKALRSQGHHYARVM